MRFPYILFPVVPTSRELCLLPSVASQPQTGGLASVMNYHDPPRDSLLLWALIVPRSPGGVRTVHSVWSCFCSCNSSKWLLRHCSSREQNVSELHNRCLRCILRCPKLGHSLSDLGQLVFSQRKEAREKQDKDISHYTQFSGNLPYPFICTGVDPGSSEQ